MNDVAIPLQIVAYKISGNTHEPVYFQGHPDPEKCFPRADIPLKQVILASAAAPTFFPLVEVEGVGVCVDGGVFENSAGIAALRFAQQCATLPQRSQLTDFTLLSLGTGEVEHEEGYAQGAKRAGLVFWAQEAIELAIAGAAKASDYNLRQLFDMGGRPHYFRLQFSGSKDKLAMDTTKHMPYLVEEAEKLAQEEKLRGFIQTMRT